MSACDHDKRFRGVFDLPKESGGCLACAYEALVKERSCGPEMPQWRKGADDTPKCKGVHFLRHEAAVGGDVCVTAMHDGEFYEIRFKVPPFATGMP